MVRETFTIKYTDCSTELNGGISSCLRRIGGMSTTSGSLNRASRLCGMMNGDKETLLARVSPTKEGSHTIGADHKSRSQSRSSALPTGAII